MPKTFYSDDMTRISGSEHRLERRLALRSGDVLRTLEREWASEKPQIRFKYLAILQLWSHGGWTLEQIGHVFNHPKGHVTRIINNTIAELRERFEADWASFASENEE